MAKLDLISKQVGNNNPGNAYPVNNPHPHYTSLIHSMSTVFLAQITNHYYQAEVVGVYKRAVNVLVEKALVAFVLPDLGNGPFHVVVNKLPIIIAGQELIYCWNGEKITLGNWAFQCTQITQYWNPKPQWGSLNINLEKSNLLTNTSSQILSQNGPGNIHTFENVQRILTPSKLEDFKRSLREDSSARFSEAVTKIVGLGPGLTPTGDDFLAGFMLSLWALQHKGAEEICHRIADAAYQRTTYASIAYLQAIAEGRADERWHQFIYALDNQNSQLLFSAISHILAFGATSGSDMLFGFLWGIEFQQSAETSTIVH